MDTKALGWLTVLFLLFVTTSIDAAAAECLTQEQEDALIAVALANNQSPSFFITIFESMCDRSYTRNETDIRMGNAVSNLTDYVEDEVSNYTDWVEKQLQVREYLEDMVVILNASHSIEEIEDHLNQENQKTIDQLDSQINQFKADYATKSWVTSEMRESRPVQAQATGWEWPIVLLVVGLAAMLMFKEQIRKNFPGVPQPFQRASPLRPASFYTPGAEGLKALKNRVTSAAIPQPPARPDAADDEEERNPAVDEGVGRGQAKDNGEVQGKRRR